MGKQKTIRDKTIRDILYTLFKTKPEPLNFYVSYNHYKILEEACREEFLKNTNENKRKFK